MCIRDRFVGGALHRNVKTIRAVILGTSGIAASTIVARKIESRIEEIKIVAILSSELMDTIDQYDCCLLYTSNILILSGNRNGS